MIRKKIKNILSKNDDIFNFLKLFYFKCLSALSLFISDRSYLYLQYFFRTGKILSLASPKLFNEKIQWYKLYYRKKILNKCVDKWEVRSFIADKGLSDILIPAFGPYNDVADIDFSVLPDQIILKLTNGSGFNEIFFDKKQIDLEKLKSKFYKWKKINFYHSRREWAYKDVSNRIICESLLCDDSMSLPSDIRFFCFNGEVKLIAVDLESVKDGKKTSNYYRHLFTPQWNEINASIQYSKKQKFTPDKPINLDKMITIAKILSEGFPFVRVDLYNIKGKIFFGELTFYHASGYQKISPESFELEMGNWFSLDNLH